MNTNWKLGLALVSVLSFTGGVVGTLAHLGLFQEVPPGLLIGGRVVSSEHSLGEWIEQRRSVLWGEETTLATPEGFHRVRLGDLGVEVDVSATLREARRVLAGKGPRGWWSLSRRARAGAIDIPLVFHVLRPQSETFLKTLASEVYREPQNARLDLLNHARVADVPGAELDTEATIASLEVGDWLHGEIVELSTRPIQAPFTLNDILNIDVSKVLASSETTFSLFGTGAGRAVNIANAAKHLNGWVIAPGEVFSFNKVVGPRTLETGFTYAPEIVDEEMEMGVGGGTCQVSTTLHVAALEGALDIVERAGHSRPSSYTKLGMDATVAYGKVDLKFRNPFPFPLIIHAFLPKPTAIRIELLGAEPQAKVDYSFAIQDSKDFYRRITYKPGLSTGAIKMQQKGRKGHEVVSRIVTRWKDGRTTERMYFSAYRPVPEVFWVGRDVDENQLPDLPEGVTRVQRRNFARTPPPTQVEGGAQPSSG